ncbi:hypothetical protein [Streptomyces sp. NPDC046887]|uniref:hypothetical protein n=1 Tax=Streptomyces sp. NPDC046887 TaxID=3155472 RepID=UPI00340F1FDE
MSGYVRVGSGGPVIGYAALAAPGNACEALDEVAVAAKTWSAAKELIRAHGYRRLPTRPTGTVPPEAIKAALSAPGTVLRKPFMAKTPWTPAPAQK